VGQLDGKVAVVTGGASGIGAATVRLFVREGARVAVVDVQDDRGHALADELGTDAVYLSADVTEEREIAAAVARACERWDRLDVLFNNAGFGGALGPIESTSAEDYTRTVDVLLKGVFLGIKHAAPVMKRQRSGSIVNTGSVAGLTVGHGPHLYSAAKAAVVHLTRSVAMELGEANVRVNCICPGGILTPLLASAAVKSWSALDAAREVLTRMQAIPRAGLPEDIANAALFLASDASSFVNGEVLVVDGGLQAGVLWRDQNDLWKVPRPLRGGARR
jgi:NAD(P)-dependent dehydrogenase (short-subunit alcohol dehydrogenase family)